MFKKVKDFFRRIFGLKVNDKSASGFETLSFPMIRRASVNTVATRLVSVQPMAMPMSPEPENVYSRDVIIEKAGFRARTERKRRSGSIVYFEYKLQPRHPVQYVSIDINIGNESITRES